MNRWLTVGVLALLMSCGRSEKPAWETALEEEPAEETQSVVALEQFLEDLQSRPDGDERTSRDPFAKTKIVSAPLEKRAESTKSARTEVVVAAEPSPVTYKLSGTTVVGGIAKAIVNGMAYREGDTIGSYLVDKIGAREIALARDEEIHVVAVGEELPPAK